MSILSGITNGNGGSGGSGNATSIQGVPVSPTAPTDGYFLEYTGGAWRPEPAPSGSFSPGNDLSGNSSSQNVIGLTGTAGVVGFHESISSPTINQTTNPTNSATAQNLTIAAQSASGTSSTGGALVLSSGHGSNGLGPIRFEIGGNLLSVLTGLKLYMGVGDNINVATVSTNYSVLYTDNLILIKGETANTTITMPGAGLSTLGDLYKVCDSDGLATTYSLVVSGGGNLINGQSTYTLQNNYESIDLVWNGSAWNII